MVSRSPNDPFPTRTFTRDLCNRIPRDQYEKWFNSTQFEFVPPDRLVISVPSPAHKRRLESSYMESILLSARSVFNVEPQVDIELRQKLSSPVRDEYTFDNFVVGAANRVASAACLTVSESQTGLYNPLLIYGGTGLGKSHLLQAAYLKLRTDKRIRPIYLTCDEFAHRVSRYAEERHMDAFRARLTRFDAFIVDDLQGLARLSNHQEELYWVINSFLESEKQLIFSCDCAPWNLGDFSERLVSRLRMGLVSKLEPPGFDLLVAILKDKAQRIGLELGDEIAEALARGGGNPRDLQGIVVQLASLGTSRRQDWLRSPEFLSRLSVFQEALDSSRPDVVPRSIELQDILRATASYFGKKHGEVVSVCRERSIVRARQVAMYLSRELTQHSFEEIGNFFGGRDHATVIHAVNKIRRMQEVDPILRRDLLNLFERLAD